MTVTFVPSLLVEELLERLSGRLNGWSPQIRTAARYVIDNPSEVAVDSMRRVAGSAGVHPNTLIRLARAAGYSGYQEFRQPFREAAIRTAPTFTDRVRWLQSINVGGRHGELLARMAGAVLDNTQQMFDELDTVQVKAAADAMIGARQLNVLGVGVAQSLAENFCYVASMIGARATPIPRHGCLPIDDVSLMGSSDVLMAMTFAPYRVETVEATSLAAARGATVIAVSDSRTSPICEGAQQAFVVPTDTPQYFSSMAAATALLETLLAFMAADSSVDAAAALEEFHGCRRQAGIYTA